MSQTNVRKVNVRTEVHCSCNGKLCEGTCRETNLNKVKRHFNNGVCPAAYNPTNNRDRRVSDKSEAKTRFSKGDKNNSFRSRHDGQNRSNYPKVYGYEE